MTARMDDATRAQVEAARPDVSTWLTANAGSGKTRVLTDRVARLLLAQVDPQQILCLTYTKAAASEMQNRLFKRLGEWAMLEDGPLQKALAELGVGDTYGPGELRWARTLFSRAIETPGGLKIQTIHSFCASILRRFPLEAGVNPQFTEIEDRAADLLRADIVEEMAEGSDTHLVAALAGQYTGEDFASLTQAIVSKRDRFAHPLTRDEILDLFDQPADLSEETLHHQVFLGNEETILGTLIPALMEKGGNDAKAGDALQAIGKLSIDTLPVLEKVFLTGSGAKAPFTAKIGSFPTKATREGLPSLMPSLEDFMLRVEQARNARLALQAVEKTAVLHQFAQTFLARYEAAKQQRGWLDFDGLILRTRDLLNDPRVAAWVLYRIDGGIDHILVDEAQDTSPRQWEVIERLADEFYSGQGARTGVERTLFVVGDKKQSIYSFQGADPEGFDDKGRAFEEKIKAAQQIFQHRSLDYSFRSSSAILRLVDQTFDARLQGDLEKESQHIAFKSALPGRVDVWPLVEKQDTEDEDRDWTDPVDRRSARHHSVILAEKIAAQIKELITGEHYIPTDTKDPGVFEKRRVRAGDFLVLVQRRGDLFAEIIRACKAAELPIAGADRLKVGAELAVKDLAALLSFLATPDDDLSLAAALKSPLFGWSEQALFTLAHYRSTDHLWQTLRDQVDTHPQTLAMLHDLRGQVDFLRPYDLIERVLTRHDGRARLLARLGPEAEDGINAMLTQALAYERTEVPSLTGFLQWMQTDALEIKRQIDNSSDQIRVMSVHGAKGLEAPIVILPDTAERQIRINDEVIELADAPIWKPSSAEMPESVQARVEAMREAQQRERMRLLYVAMTRAEKWLIVAAAGDLAKNGSDWYSTVKRAMDHVGATPVGDTGVLRFEEGDWDALPPRSEKLVSEEITGLDTVFSIPAEPATEKTTTLSPSDLGGAKALPGELGEDEDTALSYGSLVHLLLENLAQVPEAQRETAASAFAGRWDSKIFGKALEEVMGVLDDVGLKSHFQQPALTEVPVTADIANLRLHGAIDRLVIGKDTILAVDFKTNRVVPTSSETCPEGLLRQMGAYTHMLGLIYPEHKIETAILWTATRELMVLPHETVMNALWRSPHLDGAQRHS